MALTVQLVLWALALLAAVAGLARLLRLLRPSRADGAPPGWDTLAGAEALSRAVRPLWLAAVLVLAGAAAPRVLAWMQA
ncbi:hypothetical protein [Xanthomonas massiliensis]|jgi:hypothetical protein|uniref:hypothetical protein n=1 Tax=Xanthomonas massiliensis TaxID=1720302 RepID=UPI000824F2B7|nr:hypothetical protein [Xanthomonas massiliensis]